MRGKAKCGSDNVSVQGITPAYAGKSHNKRHPEKGGRDHPRLCGEKTSISIFTPPALGSPPPMRGKDKNDDFGVQQIRITPAYAGKRL